MEKSLEGLGTGTQEKLRSPMEHSEKIKRNKRNQPVSSVICQPLPLTVISDFSWTSSNLLDFIAQAEASAESSRVPVLKGYHHSHPLGLPHKPTLHSQNLRPEANPQKIPWKRKA